MRKGLLVTMCVVTISSILLLSWPHMIANAQSRPAVIPVNIDGYLQNPNVSVTVNWQLQQSIQWYSNQYEFKVTSVAPVAGDTSAPPGRILSTFS